LLYTEVVAHRLLGAAAVHWEAGHSLAAAAVNTVVVRSDASIADCTAPDIVEFAVIAASPNSATHID
jgi:hypothetical protein